MSLRLIYGRAGSGKSHFCLNDIKFRLDNDGNNPLILLVPEQFSFQAEKNLMKTVGMGAAMRSEVLSFRRMAHRVFNEVGGVRGKYINSAGKCMLIYSIMHDMKDNLKVFSGAARQQGFVNTLSQTIAEFKKYTVSAASLIDIASGITQNDYQRDKIGEIASIYDQFEKRLHERYLDSEDHLTNLALKLDRSNQFNGAEFWIDEFSGFTPQEYRIIEKLFKKAVRVNVCLCTDSLADNKTNWSEVFSLSQKTAGKLMDIAKANNVKIEESLGVGKEGIYRFKNSEEIRHLESNYFSYPYSRYTNKTQDINIFCAVNIYSEVDNTARDIIRLCRDNGVRYRDIAVVSRNLEEYKNLIGVVFEQYGIPYFIDRKRDIKSHPLVLLVLSAIEILSSNWSYQSVFRYLKTGLTDMDRDSIDVLENYVLAWGIKGKKMWMRDENWEFRETAEAEGYEEDSYQQYILDKVNEVRKKVTAPFIGFLEKIKGTKSTSSMCRALFDFLCDVGIPDSINKSIEGFEKNGQLDLANEYRQIWNILMEAIDQIVDVDVDGKRMVDLKYFERLLSVGLGEYSIGIIPPAVDQVLVGSIERSRSHQIVGLYILGVNDGVFPAGLKEEGILSDNDRDSLCSMGVELDRGTRIRALEEQFFIYKVLTTPGSYLRISYPIADFEGKTMRPSTIIGRLKKIFPNINESSNISGAVSDEDDLELVTGAAATFNGLICKMRDVKEGVEIHPLWRGVYKWYIHNEDWKDKCFKAISGLNYSNSSGYIGRDNVRKLYGDTIYTSVSRLESFVSCPFSYFIKYGLKAKERKVFTLSAPDIGTFMHSVIDIFSKKLADDGMSWRTIEREWCKSRVSDIVDDLLLGMYGYVLNSSERYRYLCQRLKRILTRAVWLIAVHIKQSGFEPLGYEMSFGDNKSFPPIVIELASGDKIKLTGRIDRVDAISSDEGTYIRVVDYKSGSKSFKLSDVYYGLQIQLITYLDAIAGSSHNEGVVLKKPVLPGGILLFRIDDPVVKGSREASQEEIEKAIMKQLRMKGLLLADVKLIKEMDRSIEGNSMIIPARINKDGTLGKSSAVKLEQFDMLRGYVKKLLQRIGQEMLEGKITLEPYKKKDITACTYCSYSSVCRFDSTLKDNKYKLMKDIKDEDVWDMFKDGGES